jgi:hypothetical protein
VGNKVINQRTYSTDPTRQQELALTETAQTVDRPIIFVAHSLGGTIVKSVRLSILCKKRIVFDQCQALLYADSTPTTDLRSVRLSTRGAIFMGTPELDSRLIGLQSYLANAKGSEQESSDIYKEAHWLVTTLQSYPSISQQFWTLFVHESSDSLSVRGTLDQVRAL